MHARSTLALTVRLQLGASCPPCPPSSCSIATPDARRRDAEPWWRSAETVAAATARVKSSVVIVAGSVGWTALAICSTCSTSGVIPVCCRCEKCLPTVGEGGAGSVMCAGGCCRCSCAPDVGPGLGTVDARMRAIGGGSCTLPVVVATLGFLRSPPAVGVFSSLW